MMLGLQGLKAGQKWQSSVGVSRVSQKNGEGLRRQMLSLRQMGNFQPQAGLH